MASADLDSWLVRTDYYLHSTDEAHVEYITVRTGRRRLWPRLIAGAVIAVTTFVITAYVI